MNSPNKKHISVTHLTDQEILRSRIRSTTKRRNGAVRRRLPLANATCFSYTTHSHQKHRSASSKTTDVAQLGFTPQSFSCASDGVY